MIVDCFTYNGEKDILDLRLNILDKHVDQFIIVEAHETFTGNYKPLYFKEQSNLFEKWEKKIKYFVIDENYTLEELQQAVESPNTVGAAHWKREFLQKESIKKALTHLDDNDVCFIGDVDEIWDASALNFSHAPFKLNLRVYAYWLDYSSSEQFFGTLISPYKDIKNDCLNHLRMSAWKTQPYCGWHFTSMGGFKEVRRKLNDSYTEDSYNTPEVQELLSERLREGQDYLGRDFTFTIDESNWPEYLKKNRKRYAHLCRGTSVLHSGRGRYND